MNGSVAQCQHLLSVAKAIFVGLDDSHRAFEPQVGTKTAGWLIGHLAVTGALPEGMASEIQSWQSAIRESR